MMVRFCCVVVALLLTTAGYAQSQPATFAVVRVSPSPDSEADDWGTGIRGRNFWAVHVTLNELICWAYGISARQISGGPAWVGTEHFDVNGLPDSSGPQPTIDEFRAMAKAALADRFSLRLHPSEKFMPVYVLSQSDGGIKLRPVADVSPKSNWGIHRGWLSITNMAFDGVAKIMQRTVFDRPVLNRTNLPDKYTFVLKWRADETQFTSMRGMDMPEESGTEDVDDIVTSARKQLGLRIESRREPAPVLVIESASQPSPN